MRSFVAAIFLLAVLPATLIAYAKSRSDYTDPHRLLTDLGRVIDSPTLDFGQAADILGHVLNNPEELRTFLGIVQEIRSRQLYVFDSLYVDVQNSEGYFPIRRKGQPTGLVIGLQRIGRNWFIESLRIADRPQSAFRLGTHWRDWPGDQDIAFQALLNKGLGYDQHSFARAIENNDVESIALFALTGLDLNSPCPDVLPLTIAARNGHVEALVVLLDGGADPGHKGSPAPPLHAAAAAGHKDIVLLLLSQGVDPNSKDSTGDTALLLALRNGHANVVDVLIGGFLYTASSLQQNSYRELRDRHLGFTYPDFFRVIEQGDLGLVQLFLDAGMDPNASLRQLSARQYARLHGHEGIERFLLRYGAR
jgi:hypothetical protein